jgi:hypothetical protein
MEYTLSPLLYLDLYNGDGCLSDVRGPGAFMPPQGSLHIIPSRAGFVFVYYFHPMLDVLIRFILPELLNG